jgi:hypothetical protein
MVAPPIGVGDALVDAMHSIPRGPTVGVILFVNYKLRARDPARPL